MSVHGQPRPEAGAEFVDFESFDDGFHESWDMETAMHRQAGSPFLTVAKADRRTVDSDSVTALAINHADPASAVACSAEPALASR